MVIGFTLFYKITSSNNKQNMWWIIIYCSIISVASITNYQTASKNTWWGWSSFEVDMAKIINRSDNPLVISQERIGNIMPLFYMLKENSRTLMLDTNDSTLPKGIENGDVFLLNPSPEIRETYKQLSNQSLDVVYQYQEGMINIKLYMSK
jgi:hypothetical protein